MNKPGQFFAFLLVLALVVSGLSLLIGGRSVVLGDAELSYYSPSELFGPLWSGSDSVVVEVKENEALDALINEGDSVSDIPVDSASTQAVCDALRPCAVVGFGHEFPVIGRQHDVSDSKVIHEQNNHRTRKTN